MNTRTLPSLRIPSHRGRSRHVLHHRFNLTTQRTALSRYMKIHIYIRTWSLATERVWVRRGLSVCTCLFVLTLHALHFLHSGAILFRFFFDHTCTFYVRNTYKCKKTVFPTFLNKLKEFTHTCTFYLRNTYKSAMTGFLILKKKT